MTRTDLDVAIIGAGPAGIAAATALMRAGIGNIAVFEREAEIGGIPRHTHHPTFGLRVFRRPMTGPDFIARIRRRCASVRFEVETTVTAIGPGGALEIATPTGLHRLRARHVILATGARETPRHPRLVPGLRPQGITTTGALQQFIYARGLRPFSRPVIVGTELVSFSALWTLRHAGIQPVAMIDSGARITAWRPAGAFARALGVPIHLHSRIEDIDGIERLERLRVQGPDGTMRDLPCDGLIFSGCFVGENTLARAGHLDLDPDNQIPRTDQNRLTSDPGISAIGNAIHPADMGDQCYQEGLRAGAHVAGLLQGRIAAPGPRAALPIRHGDGIKMTTPSMLRGAPGADGADIAFDLDFHVTRAHRGAARLLAGDRVLAEKRGHFLPARRITLRRVRIRPQDAPPGQALKLVLA